MAKRAASDSDNQNLELRLVETGKKLEHPPTSSTDLLSFLDEVENCLSRVDQKPSESMQNGLSVIKRELVAKPLFRHSNEDVRIAVASCICQLTRITAPDTPYDDPQMKEVFKLIVSSLKNLSHKCSRSYVKRASILGNVAKLRLCLVMLDLDCDALLIVMFQHFVDAMRNYHPKNIFTYMEMIITQILKESENISVELLLPILSLVQRDNKEVLPIAQKVVERVLAISASELKPYLMQAVEKSGFSLGHYSKIVASICQETSGAVEQNVATTSDNKEDKEIPEDLGSNKPVDLANGKPPKLVSGNSVVQTREVDSLADASFLKKREHGHLAGKPINAGSSNIADRKINASKPIKVYKRGSNHCLATSIDEADNSTETMVNNECKSETKNILTKSYLESMEPSKNLYIYKEGETLPDHGRESKDNPGSSHKYMSIDGTASLQNLEGTGIQPSNLEPTEPSEDLYLCMKHVDSLPDCAKDSKNAPGASHEGLPVDGAVSLENRKETGNQLFLESTEPSEVKNTCEKIVETLSDDKRDSKHGHVSLHKDLPIDKAVSLGNDKETGFDPSLPQENAAVVVSTFRKSSEGTRDSEAKRIISTGEKLDVKISKDNGRDSKYDPHSLLEDLLIGQDASSENDKGTVNQFSSPKAKKDELTDHSSSIPSGGVPDAQPQQQDSIFKEVTPVVDDAFRKASDGTGDSEAEQTQCSWEKVANMISKEDKTSTEIDETENENDFAAPKLGADSRNGDDLSLKLLEVEEKRDQVKCMPKNDGTKSSIRNDGKASVSVEYGENPMDFKIKVFWPKDQMGQMSAFQDKVQYTEPSNLQTSEVEGTVTSNIYIHINDGQPKKRKSVASKEVSASQKWLRYNTMTTNNTFDDMSPASEFKTRQKEYLNETTLYQKCLEELQDLEGLDDDEFAKAVNILKDAKNAIAFITIKGPRRLVWLRSLWQAL